MHEFQTVSLRTQPDRYADAAAFAELHNALTASWGAPAEASRDDNFIDLRPTRWDRGVSRIDLEFIPGVVAVVFYPSPHASAPVPAGTPSVAPAAAPLPAPSSAAAAAAPPAPRP